MKKKVYDIVFEAQYEGLTTKQATDKLLSLFSVVGQSEQLPCGNCKPMEYDIDGIRHFKCRICGNPMK